MKAGRKGRGGVARNVFWELALLPVMLSGLGGCESAQTAAAHKIADALPRALGPAQQYRVQVSGDTFALAEGHAQRIQVEGDEVRVAPHATLDTLDVEARDVSFDPQTRRITSAASLTFTGTIGQSNLSHYVAATHPDLPGLSVQLGESEVIAELPITRLHTTATVRGTLAPDAAAPDHLDFVADGASLGALPIPAMLVNAGLSLVNPLFDLSHISFPVAITQASVADHQIVLQGTASLPAHTENGQAPSASSHV